MADTILKMSGITKVFGGVVALNGAQLELKKGEIHALIGENGAGKSTLMKILLGMHKRDQGEIVYRGKAVNYTSPADALKDGISMIHQEISLVSELNVSENIWLGREKEFGKFGYINIKKRDAKAKELLESLKIDIDPRDNVEKLSIAQMQLVEIARAISYNPSIIIMDEPTSALTGEEIEKLYEIIRDLARKGVSVVFISHKLEELYAICDTVTVMRDGNYIATRPMKEVDKDDLIRMIAGRKIEKLYERQAAEFGEVAFEVQNLEREGVFSDISFSVRKGEVFGLCGLMGAGRSEILRAIFGIDKLTSGKILIDGKEVTIRQPKDAVNCGIGMVTEDRLRQGVIRTMSVMQNATLAVFDRLCNLLTYNSPHREAKAFGEKANELSVKYSSPAALIGELSGGNQQKIIIERWLLTNSKVLFLDEPTRGIDIGAKSEIYALIDRLAKEGLAIVMVSSEMPELLSLCDRIMVIREGRNVHEVPRTEATQENLMNYAFGNQ